MNFNIQDQLIKKIEFGTLVINVSEETLISNIALNTLSFGICYNNGVLTISDNLLEGLFSLSPSGMEVYVDENKTLKLR